MPAELGEEPLDGVEPRARSWRKVEHEARVAIEPGADHLGVFVGGVVVEDDMDHFARRCLVDAGLHEPLLPAPDAGLRLAGLPHNLVCAKAVGGRQDDGRSPNMLLGALRSLAIASSERRSGGVRQTEIPVRMDQTRMRASQWESQNGLFC